MQGCLIRNIHFRRYKLEFKLFSVNISQSGDAVVFELTADILEATIKEQMGKGKNVKGFFLVNPNNPLGEVYSSDLVLQLMSVCHR